MVPDPDPFTQEGTIPIPFTRESRRRVSISGAAVPAGPDPFTRIHNKRKKIRYINKNSMDDTEDVN